MKIIRPRFLLILLFFISSLGNSQNSNKVKIFLDENLKEVSEKTFDEKNQSFIYEHWTYETDSVKVYKIVDNFKFGKFSSDENNQIREILNEKIDSLHISDETLILFFRDTLKGFEQLGYPRKKFNLTVNQFKAMQEFKDETQKKCIKQDAIKGFKRLHLYSYNNGYSYQSKNYSWNQIPPFLAKYLFHNRSSTLILKPNGDYFYYIEYFEGFIDTVLKSNDWTPYHQGYEMANKNLTQKLPSIFLKNVDLKNGVLRNVPSKYKTGCYNQ